MVPLRPFYLIFQTCKVYKAFEPGSLGQETSELPPCHHQHLKATYAFRADLPKGPSDDHVRLDGLPQGSGAPPVAGEREDDEGDGAWLNFGIKRRVSKHSQKVSWY